MWPAALLIGSGRSLVLVDDVAEESRSPYRAAGRDDAAVVVGWVLFEAPVWTVVVEVALILGKDAAGMTLTVDQHPVGAFGVDAWEVQARWDGR
jgi:hypothetical protein